MNPYLPIVCIWMLTAAQFGVFTLSALLFSGQSLHPQFQTFPVFFPFIFYKACQTLLVVSNNGKLRIFCTLWHFPLFLWQQRPSWMDSTEKTEIQINFANSDKWWGAGREIYIPQRGALQLYQLGSRNKWVLHTWACKLHLHIQIIWQMGKKY